ncbi:hypothetical protein MXB_711 [Myxobolus squamalis]|nr:hypothetical protein MXB_711 [Myxobolus squamalis]
MNSKIRLGMAWNNQSHMQVSLVIWNKELIIVKDFNYWSCDKIYSKQESILIQSMYIDLPDINVVSVRLTSNALYVVAVLVDNDVVIFHRPTHNMQFGKETGVTENIPILLQVYEEHLTGRPTSLILAWSDRVYIYDIIESKFQNFIFIACSNSDERVIPLIDAKNKILILIKLDCLGINLIATHLVCYPFKFKTLSFVAEISSKDPTTLLLYDYHTRFYYFN